MDIFGIGIQEILFILLIALIIFGPKDIIKAGRTAGTFLRKIITSPTWQTVQKTSRDLRSLPNKLIRDVGLEEAKESLEQISNFKKPAEAFDQIKQDIGGEMNEIGSGLSAWTTPSPPEEPDQRNYQEELQSSQTSKDQSEAS